MKKLIQSVNTNPKLNTEEKLNAISITLTHDCNLNCHYCYDTPNRKKIKKQFLNLNGFKIFLLNYSKFTNKQTILNFLGGEPTLHPNFIELLKETKKYNNLITKVTTNGSADISLYLEASEILKDNLEINISYHPSNNKGINHYICLLDSLKTSKSNISLRFLFDNKENISKMKEEFNILKDHVEDIKFDSLFGVEYDEEHLQEVIKIFSEEQRCVKHTYDDSTEELVPSSLIKVIDNPYKGLYCTSLFSKFMLTLDLKFVVMCDPKSRIDALKLSEFKKLRAKLYDNVCSLDKCICWMYFKKSVNKLKEENEETC